MFRAITNYFSEKLTPPVRHLHYLVLFLVLLQIVLSNFMELQDDGAIGQDVLGFYGTWAHISVGLSLVVLGLVFAAVELSKHGFSYFFPYLSGDFTQLIADLGRLRSLQLPEVSPGGLAAIIQGLGLGALLLVALSGATWFGFWWNGSALAGDVVEIHELLTGLIEAYMVGHGGMGIIHIYLSVKERIA